MKRVLLLEDRRPFQQLYSLNLYFYTGAQVSTATSLKEALVLLDQQAEPFDLAVSKVGDDDLASQLTFKIRETSHHGLKVVALADGSRTGAKIDRKNQLQEMMKVSAKAMDVTASSMASEKVGEYFPVPVDYLLADVPFASDAYTKKPDGSWSKFLNKGEYLGKTDLEQLIRTGTQWIFIPAGERLLFVNQMTKSLIEEIQDSTLSHAQRSSAAAKALSVVQDKCRTLGVDDHILEVANASIELVKETVKDLPTLDKLVNEIFRDYLSYRYKINHLITYISFHILSQTDYDTPANQQKIAMCGFFHNVLLTKDDMAKIYTQAELLKSKLNVQDKKLVETHALKTAEMLQQSDKIPSDVITIVKQHHGQVGGVGFGEPSSSLHRLSAIFLLSQEWSRLVIKYMGRPISLSKEKVLRNISEKYTGKQFESLLPLLETLSI